MQLSSRLLEQAVAALNTLPSVGKKTALRLAMHLLQQDSSRVEDFCQSILAMRKGIKFCQKCHNISDDDICHICLSPSRQTGVVCVVESIKEAMAIENSQHYNGQYHVLGGLISPSEGISPNQLQLQSLFERVRTGGITELIMALSPTIEGETTIHYIAQHLRDMNIKISSIARGVSFGSELEYADEMTLGRSIIARTPIQR